MENTIQNAAAMTALQTQPVCLINAPDPDNFSVQRLDRIASTLTEGMITEDTDARIVISSISLHDADEATVNAAPWYVFFRSRTETHPYKWAMVQNKDEAESVARSLPLLKPSGEAAAQTNRTEAEEKAAKVLEAWQIAKTNERFHAHLSTWEHLRWAVDMYLLGEYPHESAVQNLGQEEAEKGLAAVRTIAELFPMFGDETAVAE